MKKQIRLNAVDMNCAGGTPGLWLHPQDRTIDYHTLEYWTELARLLERGLFDCLFIADIFGVYDVYGGNAEAAFRNAVEFPVNDPFLLIPAMALVTEHLGFAVTGTVSYEAPFRLARSFSTLDHLTKGRIGWNIVTGYLDSAARAFGQERQMAHDERYDKAEEFMQVVYQLWEQSWEADAIRRDKANRIFAEPGKIHKIEHRGKYFQVEAYHLCEPSPQRTPLLFQAGASPKGRRFAARHAECVFISGFEQKSVKATVDALRAEVAAAGRDPARLLIFTALVVIAAETDEAARHKVEEYRKHVSPEGTLALLAGYLGIDFASRDWNEPLDLGTVNAIQSSVESLRRADPKRAWTIRDVVDRIGVAGYKPLLVGSAKTVADGLEDWMEQTGVDGFNIEYIVSPGDFTAFVDLVVPELQARGVYKTEYREGSLRAKFLGRDHRV
ncbi:MAG: LLM class flavin-dependent oxidoreductase [Bryobacterales bacterium]|nr:LLM class flavin-dependent oxidoreductase [Bryobacterales bacterium]